MLTLLIVIAAVIAVRLAYLRGYKRGLATKPPEQITHNEALLRRIEQETA